MKKILSFLLVITTLISLFCLSASADGFDHTSISSNEEWSLLEELNNYRIKNGLAPLGMFAALQDASHIRAAELLGSLSHYRPDGKPWYTVFTANELEYDTSCFEVICANYPTAKSAADAISLSEVNSARLLSNEVCHLGIGYAASQKSANSNAWEIIGLNCEGVSSISVMVNDEIHIPAGTAPNGNGMYIEALCPHGLTYLPVYADMISGFDPYMTGRQSITIKYMDHTAAAEVICDYKDVKPSRWYYEPVMSCTEKGYFSGTSKTEFSPESNMTRAMFVTVLGRYAGIDVSKYTKSSFTDIKAGQWYAPYVEWAAQNGIVSGTGNNKFSPNKGITRQEICTIITRYFERYSVTLPQIMSRKEFTDSEKIASWAANAVSYCQTRGIITGDAKGAFNPTNTATRAEVAVIITNMDNKTK